MKTYIKTQEELKAEIRGLTQSYNSLLKKFQATNVLRDKIDNAISYIRTIEEAIASYSVSLSALQQYLLNLRGDLEDV